MLNHDILIVGGGLTGSGRPSASAINSTWG